MLSIKDHRRDSAGMRYIYPVVSRRAGGVSIGINLNVNNACNWACIYCQVPDLKRGGPPEVDLHRLESELYDFLQEAISGRFLKDNAPEGFQQLVDIAFSGNGEPTSAREFPEAIDIVGQQLDDAGLLGRLKIRLITNGSLMRQAYVQKGIARIGELGGEVWFKIDRGSREEIFRVNGTHTSPVRIRKALSTCAGLASTWVQTCLFSIDGMPIGEAEFKDYLELLVSIRSEIQGVHLYGLARPSLQPDAKRLSALDAESLFSFADRITALGIKVITSP